MVLMLHRLAAALSEGSFMLAGTLAGLSETSKPALDLGERVVGMVRERLALLLESNSPMPDSSDSLGLKDQAGHVHQAITLLTALEQGSYHSMFEKASASYNSSKPDPVKQFLIQQHDEARQEAWAGQYRPKEQGVHARLLEQYGRASADRAGEQQPQFQKAFQQIWGEEWG
jgi:hypothetical protein